jgi:hypothetical protein
MDHRRPQARGRREGTISLGASTLGATALNSRSYASFGVQTSFSNKSHLLPSCVGIATPFIAGNPRAIAVGDRPVCGEKRGVEERGCHGEDFSTGQDRKNGEHFL